MRIARDLHDSAGHAINVILFTPAWGGCARSDAAGAREALETIEEVARETAGEIDQLVGVLREGAGDRRGRAAARSRGPRGLVARHRTRGSK